LRASVRALEGVAELALRVCVYGVPDFLQMLYWWEIPEFFSVDYREKKKRVEGVEVG
jgi:hypothetical protein